MFIGNVVRFRLSIAVVLVLLCFNCIGHCTDITANPGSFKHNAVVKKYEQISWPYETFWYIVKGVINTRAQIGGPILLTGSWPDHGGGYSIAYFVPYDEYKKRSELGYLDEKLVDGCTSTYTFRLFRYIDFFDSPQGSNFAVDYLENLRNAGIVELLFVPDIEPGMYCLVFKMILQDPYYTLENEPFYEYLNLHYILSDERMKKIDYLRRFSVLIEGSITDDIQEINSLDASVDGEVLIETKTASRIDNYINQEATSGIEQNIIYVLTLAVFASFLCGYYCRNIRIRVAMRK